MGPLEAATKHVKVMAMMCMLVVKLVAAGKGAVTIIPVGLLLEKAAVLTVALAAAAAALVHR
jgi:hypothetical protein